MQKSRFSYFLWLTGLFFLAIGCNESRTIVSTKSAKVCAHANCADATIVQVTDQYFPADHRFVRDDSRQFSAAWAEFLAFRYDIPVHVFEQEVKGDAFEDFLETGRGGASVYYPSCFKEFGVETFNSIVAEIESAYGKSVSTLSYGCGKTIYADSLPKYVLGGRSSGFSPGIKNASAITWYGAGHGTNLTENEEVAHTDLLVRAAGGRYYTDIQRTKMGVSAAADYVETQVEQTMKNGGFYTNFMHWHDYYKNPNDSLIEGVTVMEPLFKAIFDGNSKNGRNSKLDYNEAVEYLYAKQAIDSVSVTAFDDKSLEIDIWKSKKQDRDYSRIDTPVTISITSDMLYGNTNINYSDEVPSAFLYGSELLLNVVLDFSKEHETIEVDLKGTDKITPIENNLVLSLEGQISVYATNEAKFVLFRRKKDAKDYAVEVVEREQSFSEKYNLPNLEDGYDYFCGAIDKRRQSTLIEL